VRVHAFLRVGVWLGLVGGSLSLAAQTTEAAIRERLVNKPLFLRQQYRDNNLRFGPAGELRSVSKQGPFTLAAVDIRKVTLRPEGLLIEGSRKGVELGGRNPVRMTIQSGAGGLAAGANAGGNSHDGTSSALNESTFTPNAVLGNEQLRIEIVAPTNGNDYSAQLNRIFADGVADLSSSLPVYWQRYAREHFLSPPQPMGPDPLQMAGGDISAPVPGKMPREVYTSAARYLKYGGKVVIAFHVETDGKPSHMEIIKAIGLGLDEEALTRIQQTTFKPAMRNGVPVVVRMELTIPFQLD
jgi:TonB family protein